MISALEPLILFGVPLAGGAAVGTALNLGASALARAYHRRRHGATSADDRRDERDEL